VGTRLADGRKLGAVRVDRPRREALRRALVPVALLCGLLALATPSVSAKGTQSVRVDTLASGLDVPWEIAFMPDGRALVTERPGAVRLLTVDGKLKPTPLARIQVSSQGEGGLLGLALDPQFDRNHYVYLYFTAPDEMRLERWRLAGTRLVRQASLVAGIKSGQVHDSGRIAFGPDRRLYLATGDAGEPGLAQDPTSLNGKFLSLSAHQYRGAGGVPRIISSGHRNPQGFDWQMGTGRLFATEHGPSGFDGPEGYDEVNEIVPGRNYGWPLVFGTGHPGFADPIQLYQAPIAPSGATFVKRPGSSWRGSFIFACLRGQELRRLVLDGDTVVSDEALFAGRFGRLRTVVEGPGGALYALTSNRDGRGTVRPGDDRILRIIPPRA
jgi:glucose/arabinose dehydrogenase